MTSTDYPVLEVAILDIRSGQAEVFRAAFAAASPIIASMPGYGGHELRRCAENDHRFLLLVRWDSIESHSVGFRGSPQGPLKSLRVSEDGGATFRTVPSPFGIDDVDVQAVSAADARTVYVRRRTPAGDELFRSTEAGDALGKIFEEKTADVPPSERRLVLALGSRPGELRVGTHGEDARPDSAALHASADDGR